ncbi:nickel resistance MFS transporter NreB [soil metagenome]
MAITDSDSFLAFRQLNFRRFIFSKFMLTLALQIQFVVLSWQVYEITHDPLSLGLLGLAEAIPAVGLALYGGYVSDRSDRRTILVRVIALQLIVSIALLCTSWYYTHDHALTKATPFYIIMFLVGILRSFYSPAQFPLMTQVVPREAYANSSAWNSTFWHIGVVAGSAGGGIMLSMIGKNNSYIVVLVLILLSIIQMWRIPKQPIQGSIKTETMNESIREGLRFVFKNQPVFGALTLDLVAVLFGGAVAMLPVFASDVLHVGETGFGLLRAAPFAGSVIMALYMTKHPPLKNAGRKLLFCVAAFSVCMIAFALSHSFYLSMFILALSGAFDNVSVVIRSTILQYLCPEDMRGRVSSVSTMFISSSNELGAFESGFAAKLIGLIPSVIFGGVVAVTSVGAAAKWLPELRRLDLKN